MKDMDIQKGMYRVHAYAEIPDGLGAIDMIQFHVDPPVTSGRGSYPTEVLIVGSSFGVVVVIALISSRSRKTKQPLIPS